MDKWQDEANRQAQLDQLIAGQRAFAAVPAGHYEALRKAGLSEHVVVPLVIGYQQMLLTMGSSDQK